MPEAPIRILVAYSQKLISEALALALDTESRFIVMEEKPTTGFDAVEVALKTEPDVMIIDNWLPDISGPVATRMIVAKKPRIRILLMSWLHSPSFISKAILAGAVGYLPTSLGMDELHDAIRRAHAGETEIFEKEFKFRVSYLVDRAAKSKNQFRTLETLTKMEIQTLWLLSSGRQMKDVAEVFKITPGSLQIRLHNIFKKIGARSQIEAIAMVTEAGLIPRAWGVGISPIELW